METSCWLHHTSRRPALSLAVVKSPALWLAAAVFRCLPLVSVKMSYYITDDARTGVSVQHNHTGRCFSALSNSWDSNINWWWRKSLKLNIHHLLALITTNTNSVFPQRILGCVCLCVRGFWDVWIFTVTGFEDARLSWGWRSVRKTHGIGQLCVSFVIVLIVSCPS